MDAQINAAARALAAGNVLEVLDRVALRDDPAALALRGIAMAQLGELPRARELLRLAASRFGSREAVARARCIVAEAEIALAVRDLGGSAAPLVGARRILEARGDRANAVHARCVEIRRSIVLGRVGEAESALASLELHDLPLVTVAVAELLRAEVAVRRIDTAAAAAAIERATAAASRTGFAALQAEITAMRGALLRPAARRIVGDDARGLLLAEVEAIHGSAAVVIDGCRRIVRERRRVVSLARRPILFALARSLGESWPGDVSRELLIRRAFEVTRPNDSHRARLRVEIGRLRRALAGSVTIAATASGFAMRPRRAVDIVTLAPPLDDEHGEVLALLADGNPWSSSALALALGASQRTTQRALVALEQVGRARAFGRGRAQRWVAPPITGFTTVLLLPAPVPVA
jgi:hypothetical protein